MYPSVLNAQISFGYPKEISVTSATCGALAVKYRIINSTPSDTPLALKIPWISATLALKEMLLLTAQN